MFRDIGVPYPRGLRGGKKGDVPVKCEREIWAAGAWSVWERARSLVQAPRDECEHGLSGKG